MKTLELNENKYYPNPDTKEFIECDKKEAEIKAKLKTEKELLTKRVDEINSEIKNIIYSEMLEVEKQKGLYIGCRIDIITKVNCPANSASLQFLEYLGIKNPYNFGYHQVKIGYKLRGCHYHTFFYGDIKEIYVCNKGISDE